MGNGSHQLRLAAYRDLMDGGDLNGTAVGRRAQLIASLVRVVLIKRNATVVVDVPHAVVLLAATAAVRKFVTIHALLLRQLEQLARLD